MSAHRDAPDPPQEMALPEQLASEAVRSLHARIDRDWTPLMRTACQTAAGRALWGHVIGDPIAGLLAGESCLRSLHEKMRRDRATNARELSGVVLAVRTLWLDARIEEAVASRAGAGAQVVLLGAGMDARAYRLGCLRESSVFEVDFAELLQVKEALLQEAGAPAPLRARTLVRVAADVREDDWPEKLRRTGFCAAKSTVWVLEGLLYYLTHDDAVRVLRLIAASCSAASVLLADFMNEAAAAMCRSTFLFHCEWPERLLPPLGFPEVRLSQLGDPDAEFGLLSDPQNLFSRIGRLPRTAQADPDDGTPCRRLFLVEASGSPEEQAASCNGDDRTWNR